MIQRRGNMCRNSRGRHANWLSVLAAMAASLLVISSSTAATLPSTRDFINVMMVCAAGTSITIDANIQGSIESLYEGERTSGRLSADFVTNLLDHFAESDRVKVYELYINCVIRARIPGQTDTVDTNNEINVFYPEAIASTQTKINPKKFSRFRWSLNWESRHFEGDVRYATAVAISPDDRYVAVGTNRSKTKSLAYVVLLDAVDGSVLKNIEVFNNSGDEPIRDIRYAPDGASIAILTFDSVILWNVKSGEVRPVDTGHGGHEVHDLDFSADSVLIGTVAADGQACITSVFNGSPRCYPHPASDPADWNRDGEPDRTTDEPFAIAFDPGKPSFYSGSIGGVLRFWDIANNREPVFAQQTTSDDGIYGITVSADGRSVAIAEDHQAKIFGRGDFDRPIFDWGEENQTRIYNMFFSEDGSRIILEDNFGYQLFLADVATGLSLDRTTIRPTEFGTFGTRYGLYGADFARSGNFVAMVGSNPAVSVRELE